METKVNQADWAPRPEYVYRCSACSRSLIVELLLPSEVWEQIADGAYALCPLCMDDRMTAKGLKAEALAFFRGRSLTTQLTPEIEGIVASWRLPEWITPDTIGHPRLYRKNFYKHI